jgi:hypothetical protein
MAPFGVAQLGVRAIADHDNGHRRISLTTDGDEPITRKRGVGDQEIEIAGVHLSGRAAGIRSSNRLEVAAAEPVGDGGRLDCIGQGDDNAGTDTHCYGAMSDAFEMPAKTFRNSSNEASQHFENRSRMEKTVIDEHGIIARAF